MLGICKLCQKNTELRVSHFIPKFVGKWIKRTSITGYIRDLNEVHKRVQDIPKAYWLCGDCEKIFSEWERNFANNVFYPFVDKGECVVSYGSWMSRFCASLSWRTLTYIRSKNLNENTVKDYTELMNAAELHLARYLLDQETSLCQYEQHLFPLEYIESTMASDLPFNINRYFLRVISMDVISNSASIFVYTKLPSFIVLGFIKTEESQKMRSSRIALKNGKISPRPYYWPDGFANYVFEKAEVISEVYKKIPKIHKEKFDEYIKNNSEEAGNSKLFEAFFYDYKQFGSDVFS